MTPPPNHIKMNYKLKYLVRVIKINTINYSFLNDSGYT